MLPTSQSWKNDESFWDKYYDFTSQLVSGCLRGKLMLQASKVAI
jgi:hypothetical protein